MKTKNFICIILCALLISTVGFSQVPEAMNYQGVLRDSNGDIQANETVDVRFSILNNGTSVFSETHSGVSSNDYGLINLKVGTQNTTDFGMIDWTSGTKELQVEVDAGNGFEDLGASELLSVPYAFQAGSAVGTWSESGSEIYYDSGNVGIGTATPSDDLDLVGTFEIGNGPDAFDLEVNSNGDLEIRANTTDLSMYFEETAPFNVGIGTSSPSQKLDVDGAVRADTFILDNEEIVLKSPQVISIDADFAQTDASLNFDVGNNNPDDHWDEMVATDFVTFSDKNVKKDIKALDYGLNDIMQLNPVSYIYKNKPGNEVKNGLIAQEVLNVYPDAVNQYDWDYNDETGQAEREKVEVLGISYGEFVPLLIKGMQEQQTTIQDLQNELQTLQAEIENLKNQ